MSDVALAAAVLISDLLMVLMVPMVTTVTTVVMDVMGHEDITADLVDLHPHHLSAKFHSLPISEA